MVQCLCRTVWQWYTELSYDPTIPFLSIYSRERKTYSHQELHMSVYSNFIVINKSWLYPRCLSAHNRLKSQLDLNATDCFSAAKKNGLLTHLTR